MTAGNITEHPHEIIIVKHSGGDHDEAHHGGVWKIAFADFMTAMMCFFLVMWLINAANEQTKAAVASYFNPIKLIDRNSSRKGLEALGDGPNAVGFEIEKPQAPDKTAGTEGRAVAGPEKARNSQESKKTLTYSDEHLFADPYAVLAEIAGDVAVKQNISAEGDGGKQIAGPATGASGGESYRDPFAPDFWSKQVEPPIETEPMIEAPAETETAQVVAKDSAAAAKVPPVEKAPAVTTEAAAKETPKPEELPKPAELEKAEVKTEGPPAKNEGIEPKVEATEADKPKTEAEAAKADEAEPEAEKAKENPAPTDEAVEKAKQIKQEIAQAMGTGDKLGNGLEVIATDKGVTISVTDEFDFGMFEIGSALPRRELVLAMEKIGGVLAKEKGTVTINGHTDARPFKSASYDNWRLSTARAHSAYYMLARAGLDEKRFNEVAGFADRQLKIKDDPFNAANRRIEILLEVSR